jgi:uncharacterized protein (TIGR00725 family)
MPLRDQPPSPKRPLRIGVSGGGASADPGLPAARARARELGRELARAGAVVVTGGLGGVMEEAARGAEEEGGVTVGILPGAQAAEANRWITIPIVTDLGQARNALLVLTSEALVAIGGSYGTLSEVALALKIGVPVAAVASWRMERPGHPAPPVVVFDEPIAAARWALEAARQRRQRIDAGE